MSNKNAYRMIACPDGPFGGMVKCKQHFKFSLDMENTQEVGYVTEKLFTGLLGGVVPVYFGAPDIGKYINLKRIIRCFVTPDRISKVREQMALKIPTQPGEVSLKEFGQIMEPELEECHQKVLSADVESILKEPVYADPSICERKGKYLNWNITAQFKAFFAQKKSSGQ
jgi:hypothetical protein